MITEKEVLKALLNVEDPDLKKDIVTLGMVRDVRIEGKKVSFTVMLTTPACPMKDMIQRACVNAIHLLVDKEAEVEVTMSSDVTSARDKNAVLPKVKNIIAVASGKGGVGKSTVAVNLAIALALDGAKVGLLDGDIYGPSVPLMLGLEDAQPPLRDVDGKSLMVPIEKYGLKVLSIGFLVDRKQPVVWRGPMVSSAIRQFVSDVDWGELDYMIIDLPPGTGDVHITIAQAANISGVVIVTTPQEVSLSDCRKAVNMFAMQGVNIPVIGVIENMSYFIPAELPENKYYLFGKDGGKKIAAEFLLNFLGEVPIYQSIQEGGDKGTPAVLGKGPDADAFREIARNVAAQIAVSNAGKVASMR
jgi:ATP-binding protein involved in chromosome partitioning